MGKPNVTTRALAALLAGCSSVLLKSEPAWAAPAAASAANTLVERNGSIVSVEAYAPNIVRVTIATDKERAAAGPGYGIVAKADTGGWQHRTDATGDVFASPALSITVAAQPWPKAPSQMDRYFASALPPVAISITARTAGRSRG